MPDKPEILATRMVARSRLFAIEEVDLRFPGGVETRFERLTPSGRQVVMVVPLLDADTVVLVREYAAGTDRYELSLPKGLVEPGEDLNAAADRELREEAGYGAGHLEWLTAMTVAPGYSSQVTDVILARDLFAASLPGDEPEPPGVVRASLSRLGELFARDDCSDARTIAALYTIRERIAGNDKACDPSHD